MATATSTVTVVTVDLHLSAKEAETLLIVTDCISGDSPRREHMGSIGSALYGAGVKRPYRGTAVKAGIVACGLDDIRFERED